MPKQSLHDFRGCLRDSHAAADLPCWGEVYRVAFPTMVAMADHRADGEHQRQGIDRSVILADARQVLIDEKVRGVNGRTGRVYEDVLLEHWSDLERRARGWVCRPSRADFIAYAIAPLGRCYLLNVLLLQRAWVDNGPAWIARYGHRRCRSGCGGRSWTTVSVPVPVPVLFEAIGRASCFAFTPFGGQVRPTTV